MNNKNNDNYLYVPIGIDSHESSSSCDEDDSDLEVTSILDEETNELVQLDHLHLNSDDTSDEDDFPILYHSSMSNDSDVQLLNDIQTSTLNVSVEKVTNTSSTCSSENDANSSGKRKRKAWSIKEKLGAIEQYEISTSKHATAKSVGCTRFQLSEWVKRKDEFKKLQSSKRGGKMKRLKGGGKKIKYVDLDSLLIEWFKERRTPPNTDVTLNEIQREKVSFKQLVRQGTKLSNELKHKTPSIKWYRRFMARHNLSLQRPKRNTKIPLSEVHKNATDFYNYIRKSSTWGPKRGNMGAFTPRDVCNFDESPLSLFGDQSNRSLNYVNADNDVENSTESKRFATVILTVFPEGNDRVEPVLLFKGKGRVLKSEINDYSKHVKVFFTPKAVINTNTAKEFVDYWYSRVKDGNPKLMITDCCKSHLTPPVKRSLRQKSIVIGIIPKGCTQYLQILDTHVFSTFKRHYFDASEEYIERNGPRNRLKLSASQSRIICTRLTWEAWKRTLQSIDLKEAFLNMGYIWSDRSPVTPRTLPGYVYDPKEPMALQLDDGDDDDLENRIANEAILANEQHIQMPQKIGGKQLILSDLWKQNN